MATTYELVRERVGFQLNVLAGSTSTEADFNYSLAVASNASFFDPRFTKTPVVHNINVNNLPENPRNLCEPT